MSQPHGPVGVHWKAEASRFDVKRGRWSLGAAVLDASTGAQCRLLIAQTASLNGSLSGRAAAVTSAGQGGDTQVALGLMYDNGWGVPQDDAEAMKWYRLAADQGDAHAQNNLGLMYAQGQGVPQDSLRAYMWFNLSAMQNYQEAIRNRDTAARRMTPEQIAEAQKLAREWKPKPDR